MSNLDVLEQLEADVRAPHVRARVRLGHQKVNVGLATAGLRDMLIGAGLLTAEQAYDRDAFNTALDNALERRAFDGSRDPGLFANLAEALRVYARDVQLSQSDDRRLSPTIAASYSYFTRALDLTRSTELEQVAWLRAHRGAAKMMDYWLGLTNDPNSRGDNTIFETCMLDFETARQKFLEFSNREYTWAVQFQAFLFALRGQDDDFDHALTLLRGLDAEVLAQPTIQRSIAMLSSYNAAPNPPESRSIDHRAEAARQSIAAALSAQRDDQDEFLACYSGAVSRWALLDMMGPPRDGEDARTAEERSRRLHAAEAAWETADIRTRNSASQTLVALMGLLFVKAKLLLAKGVAHDSAEMREIADKAEWVRSIIERAHFRDIESRSMVIRDPAWQAILRDEDCRELFGTPGFDRLRSFARSADAAQQAHETSQAI